MVFAFEGGSFLPPFLSSTFGSTFLESVGILSGFSQQAGSAGFSSSFFGYNYLFSSDTSIAFISFSF